MVDLHRNPGPADGSGHREIGALPQHSSLQQGCDLPVHRCDGQAGGLGDDVTGHRAAQPGRTEHRTGGDVGDPQRRGDDVVAGQQGALGVRGRTSGGGDASGERSAHGGVL